MKYAEIKLAPQSHCKSGLKMHDSVEATIDGIKKGLEQSDMLDAGVLLCAMASPTPHSNKKENLETVELVREYLGKGVVGIDFAGVEGFCQLRDNHYIFDLARKYDLPSTCHAGDSQGADTVEDAINFGVSRIGHGHKIIEDTELCRRAIRENITLEVCPTSNIQCRSQPSYKEHPIKRLYAMGVPVTVNTDNMTISGINLDHEYSICEREMGFTPLDLRLLNLNSAKASFLPDDKKNKLIAMINQDIEKFKGK